MTPSAKPTAPKRRLSLRRKAAHDGVAAELLTLLETVTADGTISEQEVFSLETWLADNAVSDLPGVEYLRTTVTQILSDGIVTAAERTAMYAAVERVLPPELRRAAKERRTAVQDIERAASREQKGASKALAREQRERDRRLMRANFIVAGVLHKGRANVVEQFASTGQAVFLVREPDNVYDSNAVEIR